MNLEVIRNEIAKRRLSQRSLAKSIGVHPNTLNRFLTGKTVLGSEALMELLNILGLSLETLRKRAS